MKTTMYKKHTPILYWFSFLLIILFLASCKSTPLVLTETKELKEVAKDCTVIANNTTKTPAIIDTIKSKLPTIVTGSKDKNCDSLCNAKLRQQLQDFKANKKSGNNELGYYYDAYNDMIVLYGKQGETISELKDQLKISSKDKSDIQKIPVPVKLPLTWWENLFYQSGRIAWGLLIIFAMYKAIRFYIKKQTLI